MGILAHNNQCIILRIRLNSQCINRERSCAIRLIFFSRGLCRALVVCWQKRHKESWSFLMDKLLLHSCCAPCSVYCVDTLRADGIEPTSLWFNPNIHPWTEYDARRRTLLEYGEKEHVEVHILEDYGLRDFVRAVSADIDHRCAHCYTIRLGTAAKYAADHGYDAFTSSLLISPYQNHELLKTVGETMGKKYGVEFYYRDFRPGFREGQAKAREMGLYMQKYCGCIFSEEDRYSTKIEKAKKRYAEE
nr:MAG TPA: hypothetical protein [Caudoviricetes sp.]